MVYHFISQKEFEQKMTNNDFFEHGKHNDNYYGTSLNAIVEVILSGRTCVITAHPDVSVTLLISTYSVVGNVQCCKVPFRRSGIKIASVALPPLVYRPLSIFFYLAPLEKTVSCGFGKALLQEWPREAHLCEETLLLVNSI